MKKSIRENIEIKMNGKEYAQHQKQQQKHEIDVLNKRIEMKQTNWLYTTSDRAKIVTAITIGATIVTLLGLIIIPPMFKPPVASTPITWMTIAWIGTLLTGMAWIIHGVKIRLIA